MTCGLCQRDTGEMNFNQVCCRVRFLMGQPNRQARAGWLDRWAKDLPQARMDEIKHELIRQFGEKKK